MFVTRTISGAVLLLIIILTIIVGGPLWLVVTGALSLMALYELLKALSIDKTILAAVSYVFCLLIYIAMGFGLQEFLMLILIGYFIAIMAVYVIKWPAYDVLMISKALFSMIYAGVCMSYLYQIRNLDNGIYMMWLVFISSWGSDTCAYLVGITLGKHKIPSTLSPKKSIEGCIGGVFGAAIIGLIYGIFLDKNMPGEFSCAVVFPIICAVGSVLSQLGDLAASAVKRNCEIKDYANLIPGHGGILDRFDSVIYIAPIIYYILYFVRVI